MEVVAGYKKGVKKTRLIIYRKEAQFSTTAVKPNGKGLQKIPPKGKTGGQAGKDWQFSRQAHSSHKPPKQFQILVRVVPPKDRSVP